MQLHADKKIPLSLVIAATDEMGNPTPADPADFTTGYEVDDPSLIALVDNGDGTAVAAATGLLGPAVVTATVTHTPSGRTATGALAIDVVPGDAEVFTVAVGAGPEEEVTPDTA